MTSPRGPSRLRSGLTEFHPRFPGRYAAPVSIADGRLDLRLLLDASSLEVFAGEGHTVLTCLVFAAAGPRRMVLSATGPEAPAVDGIRIHRMGSAR